MAEAGFGPGIPYLLSFFYLRHELGLRIGLFLSAAPLANTFAGALAYGITSGHSHLANWRLLFLVEGLPTILMAPVAFFFLPDVPEKARFLNEEERLIAKARGVRQVGEVNRIGSVVWKDVGLAFLDAKCWFTAVSSLHERFVVDLLIEHSSCTSAVMSASRRCQSFFPRFSIRWVSPRLMPKVSLRLPTSCRFLSPYSRLG